MLGLGLVRVKAGLLGGVCLSLHHPDPDPCWGFGFSLWIRVLVFRLYILLRTRTNKPQIDGNAPVCEH